MRAALVLVALLAPVLGAAQSASQRLERLTNEATERAFDLFPLAETFSRGPGPRQDKLELTFTAQHRERQRAHNRWILNELEAIPAAELIESEKLTHALLAYRANSSLEWLSLPFHYHYAFIHLNGGVAFNLVQLVPRQPFRNEADYQAWFGRLRQYPAYFDGIGALMREGAAAKLTTPRLIVVQALEQLEALAPADVTQGTLWKPMAGFPASIDAAARVRLEAQYRALLADEVFPAIRRLASYVRNDYLPIARTSDGFGALPGGARMYAYAVKEGVTASMTPDEVHALGLREVKRIQPLYLAAAAKAGFNGKLSEARRWVERAPGSHPFNTADDVLAYLNAIHARIEPQLPQFFGRLPKARFAIRPTDPAIAATTPAQYYPPSDDLARPGIFAMPIVDARKISTFGLAALLAHEGMPGHHLDGGVRLDSALPEFRRKMWLNAFGEGWALYAESLGHELGLYGDPVELMGRYSYELFRAGRLVVDTGLHAKGWTWQQAVRYLVDECGQGEGGAKVEVLRYMAWPGQALGYKVGELTIVELRAKAEKRLGRRFDLRAFHDALLQEGHLPLDMVRSRMEAWIDAQARI